MQVREVYCGCCSTRIDAHGPTIRLEDDVARDALREHAKVSKGCGAKPSVRFGSWEAIPTPSAREVTGG